MEIRVAGTEYRVLSVARFAEAVYILHSFVKKTRATRHSILDLARERCAPSRTWAEQCWKGASMKAVKTTGSVFRDLGFSPAETRNLEIRAQMMTALRKFITQQGLTQAQAARLLHVTQPRISDLTRGKLSRFSLDTLVNMLTAAGLDIDLRIKRPARRVA